MAGPLAGIKVLEVGGIGPVPFAGMLLADFGAEVVQIVRLEAGYNAYDVPGRGRNRLPLDLRSTEGLAAAKELIACADILLEGFRPGVMERLGLDPDTCLTLNPALIFGRMTGWGQTGPLANVAGHDLNYIALSGALHGIGKPDEPPAIPLNLIGDYGGGAMLLTVGVLAALQERSASGKGQVVDAAMAEGSALLSALFYGMHASGRWTLDRGGNHLDGGAPFYNTFECADGKYIAVGAIESKFYVELLEVCGIDDPDFAEQWDRERWPRLKQKMAAHFAQRTQQEWCELAQGHDICLSPVLDWNEAPLHAQHQARGAFVEVDGVTQPAPAPRFSRSATLPPRLSQSAQDGLLSRWGLSSHTLAAIRKPR